jgi:hypothetical protein
LYFVVFGLAGFGLCEVVGKIPALVEVAADFWDDVLVWVGFREEFTRAANIEEMTYRRQLYRPAPIQSGRAGLYWHYLYHLCELNQRRRNDDHERWTPRGGGPQPAYSHAGAYQPTYGPPQPASGVLTDPGPPEPYAYSGPPAEPTPASAPDAELAEVVLAQPFVKEWQEGSLVKASAGQDSVLFLVGSRTFVVDDAGLPELLRELEELADTRGLRLTWDRRSDSQWVARLARF